MPRTFICTIFVIVESCLVCLTLLGCSPELAAVYPTADLRPPSLLEAGPTDARRLLLRFDESVAPVPGSFVAQPRSVLDCKAEAEKVFVTFEPAQSPGTDYALAGEVDDPHGNRTRILVKFTGWNDRAPLLRISEVQTGKNSSKTKPHRDFIELEVLADGNIGGEELSWTSSVKSAFYRFPGVEVRKGDFIVLHLAPEGLPEERDELGADLSVSGGVDATTTGRDLWCSSMPLPDSSGAIALALRPGDTPIDGLFYAEKGKSGALTEGKLFGLLSALARAKAWAFRGESPVWEDAVAWNGSGSKSLCRSGADKGLSSWYACTTGTQSPGAANTGPDTGVSSSNSTGTSAKKGTTKRH
jgi:hypothetical protein